NRKALTGFVSCRRFPFVVECKLSFLNHDHHGTGMRVPSFATAHRNLHGHHGRRVTRNDEILLNKNFPGYSGLLGRQTEKCRSNQNNNCGCNRFHFARSLKPWANTGIFRIVFALFLTPGGVLNSVPLGPSDAPLAWLYRVFLSGPENAALITL